ncbi:ribonuclease P protein component [Candidatus Wolfebacteria bacterium CG10_big_fil_rev_8_21_14_0_10_31_9]|uniref:Ribonuclease P protein component n=1 Tax=Candidatus Wolfebacteria bacterium CG10_big_fil_rev_8_21_14_0_10_31_9 TaxID=1975070 RepID=A0A2H0RCV0_9BACT|nr:MAG: ribonuclease P protein component [Candidatus Wolfebacteria bacterium CG10_big_fil_rev_8_21_14_0_10_31_9]
MLAKKYKLPINTFLNKKTASLKQPPYFNFKIISNNLNFSRFGVVISKKVSPKAVERNKIKRTIFNFIRTKKYHLNLGKDILIIVYPETAKIEKEKIEKKLSVIEKIF